MVFLPCSPHEMKYRASFPTGPGSPTHSWSPFLRQVGGQPGKGGVGCDLVTRCLDREEGTKRGIWYPIPILFHHLLSVEP